MSSIATGAATPERPTVAPPRSAGRGGPVRVVIWSAGIAVALAAAAATAHGLYEVAVAARVPRGIAWLYPLITDGLALVAYAATARLDGPAARYAWTIVVLAAGLSGLAQAAYLAGDGGPTGSVVEVAPALRFGVGAWPAVAAAVVAHLLYLLATTDPDPSVFDPRAIQPGTVVQYGPDVQQLPLYGPDVQPWPGAGPVQHDPSAPVPADPDAGPAPDDTATRVLPSPARDRADAAALRHARRHGAWPTVTELETAAGVSRGTAATALRSLRERPLPLHALPRDPAGPASPADAASAASPAPSPDADAAPRDDHPDSDQLTNPEAHR